MERLKEKLLCLALVSLLAVGFGRAAADCIYCACNKKLYAASDLQTCQNECQAGLGCFTGICTPAHIPGDAPYSDEKSVQHGLHPNLSCYSVTLHRDPLLCDFGLGQCPAGRYNCIASAVGVTDRFIFYEVDGYGNRDGKLQISDFDAYFAYGGYVTSADCGVKQSGIEKIALFGEQVGTPAEFTANLHVARQVTDPSVDQTTGPWFESKEGDYKKMIHHLDELSGWGPLIKCYERTIP